MAELVDAHGSGPCAARCGGSSPSVGTKCKKGVCESRLPFFTPTSKAPACFAGGTRKVALASAAGVAERDRVPVGTKCKKGVCESKLPFFTPTSKAPACLARAPPSIDIFADHSLIPLNAIARTIRHDGVAVFYLKRVSDNGVTPVAPLQPVC